MSELPDPEFDAWVATLPPSHWARYDLAACRLGWDARSALIEQLRGDLAACLVNQNDRS